MSLSKQSLMALWRRIAPARERPLTMLPWAAAGVAVLAFAVPVSDSAQGGGAAGAVSGPAGLPAVPGTEDLTAFRASERWGGDSFDALAAAAAEAEAGAAGADRDNLGLVGLVSRPDSRVALLLADDEVLRQSTGDELPDGRVLAEVAPNAAVLSAPAEEGAEDDVLVLFPRATAADEAGADPGGDADSGA